MTFGGNNFKLEIISTLLRRIGIPPPTALPGESLCTKTGNQIGGWVQKFRNQFWVLLFRVYCQKNFGPRPQTLRGWEKISASKIFFGGEGPPKGYIS